MKIDLSDPTPITQTEGLLLVLNAHDRLLNNEKESLLGIAYGTAELQAAAYRIREASLKERNAKTVRAS